MEELAPYRRECVDLHVHSKYSADGTAEPRDILKTAKKKGLGGVAIVDHNCIRGGVEGLKAGVEGVVLIPGVEITTKDGGHVLALGITEPVPRDLTPQDTVQKIEELGGIVVAPHPYRFWSGLGEEAVLECRFDIVEVLNARSHKRHNGFSRKLAQKLEAGKTGGSDAHYLEHIGLGRTVFPSTPSNLDDALDMLAKKQTDGEGVNRKFSDTLHYTYKSVTLWLGRGMKRI